MAVGDAYVFPGFLKAVITQLFFPKPPTTFLTCFCRGERQKYTGKKKLPQPKIELTTTRSWVRHGHHWTTQAGPLWGKRFSHIFHLKTFILSHYNPFFQSNIAIMNFLVSYMCQIRFNNVIGQSTVPMYSYAKFPIHDCHGQMHMLWNLTFYLIRWI